MSSLVRTGRIHTHSKLGLPGSILFLLVTVLWSAGKPADYLAKPDTWFASSEGRQITANILSWQSAQGSWPKNLDTTSRPFAGKTEELQGTFDNGATTGEMRFLARAFQATKDARCSQAFHKALEHVLAAQYPTGGWPQYYPPSGQYHRHITFNDDTMVRLLTLLREIADSPRYNFVDHIRREAAEASFRRGIQCILKCQIRVKGRLTAWCAQHDEVDFQPRQGRSYELPSISGAESAGILELLMSLQTPDPNVVESIRAGSSWFASSRVNGVRIIKVDGEKRAIKDPGATGLWARFYDLENGRPIFSDREGVKKYDFNDLGSERRNGYAWYGDWGIRVEKAYAEWLRKIPQAEPSPKAEAR